MSHTDASTWPRDAQGRIIIDDEEAPNLAQLYEDSRSAIVGPAISEEAPPADLNIQPAASASASTPARPQVSVNATRAIIALAVVIALVLVWTFSDGGGAASPPRPIATPPATTAPATLTPSSRWIVAFAAPGGDVIGPVDVNAIRYRIIGRVGEAWVWIDAGGEIGKVWLRRTDLTLDPDDLAALADAPDLATPTPAPTDLPPAPPPPDTPAPAVELRPEPTVCATSVAGMGCGANAATAAANLDIVETISAQNLATSAANLKVTMTALAAEQATATAASGRP